LAGFIVIYYDLLKIR